MAGCGRCGSKTAKRNFEHTDKDGNVKVYSSEPEAKRAVARKGGSYKAK